MLDFADLEQKYGAPGALHCLQEIEKAARIRPTDAAELDPDQRLRNAIAAQDRRAA